MRNPILIITPSLAMLLGGCQAWHPGGAVYKGDTFSLRVPEGWTYATMRIVGAPPADLFATKDGIFLQQLLVEHSAIKDPLPHSKRILTAQMTPFEAAEAITGDLRSDHKLLHFDVTGNTPATVGGHAGFKLVLHYQTAEKLRVAEVRYGAIMGDRIYFLRFVAPERYYFEHDLAVFEESARTFQLGKS